MGEWNGAWSDNSELWTPELLAEVDKTQVDDGIFCMNLQDFITKFQSTHICKYNDNSHHSYAYKNQPVPEKSFFEIELDEGFCQTTEGLEILVN